MGKKGRGKVEKRENTLTTAWGDNSCSPPPLALSLNPFQHSPHSFPSPSTVPCNNHPLLINFPDFPSKRLPSSLLLFFTSSVSSSASILYKSCHSYSSFSSSSFLQGPQNKIQLPLFVFICGSFSIFFWKGLFHFLLALVSVYFLLCDPQPSLSLFTPLPSFPKIVFCLH